MDQNLKTALNSLARHGMVALAGALAARGAIEPTQSDTVVAIGLSLITFGAAQAWGWLAAHGHAKALAAAEDLADQIFALTAPVSAVVPGVQTPSGRFVALPHLAFAPAGASEVTAGNSPAPAVAPSPAPAAPVLDAPSAPLVTMSTEPVA